MRWRRFPWNGAFWWGSMWGSLFALMSTGTRLGVLSLIACLILLVAREHVERIGARAAAEPIKAGAIGVLAQLLFLPLLIFSIVLLVVTIIGIPLLALIPFAILALVIVLLVGFTSVASPRRAARERTFRLAGRQRVPDDDRRPRRRSCRRCCWRGSSGWPAASCSR